MWHDENLNESLLGSVVLMAGYDVVFSESIGANVEPDDQPPTWVNVPGRSVWTANLDDAVLL
jgi:hypothetical protein